MIMNRFTRYDVTPEAIFNQRRQIIKAMGLGAAALSLPNIALPQRNPTS
ncbi:putative TMAO/DMSO reductase [Actinobacillus pleuropneumoniae]|nr:putative TMAO/DMSO reductase [Actinobacillus pleuropneumoniae]KIE88502.1 putative TMAO/DMSO reductase [Actinobacillus pleuropneumoniae]KIE94291.1 putative TMAO/DMSO reductase [Actinobacillus pleuropneumoniae]KIE95082.1 putative TMAO/DMSO reductase [Actinobacillus pleuropneumoniae]KIE95307.1 putative TMAO/DMSO reductase [Actinobacillus pleuropneumoniae]